MKQTFPSPIIQELFNLVNEYRQTKNLPDLELSSAVSEEAGKHSEQMAAGTTSFGHDGFEDRISLLSQKLGNVRRSAENVAVGKFDAKMVLDVWLKSSGHRRNIEGSYNLTGIGVSKNAKGELLFTQIFIGK